MRILFTLLLVSVTNFVFACADSYGPDNWNVSTKLGKALSLHVYDYAAKTFMLYIEESTTQNKLKQIEFKAPEENQVWLFGSCSLRGKEKATVFALVEKSGKPGWAKKYYLGYDLDTETLSLKEVNLNKIKCYDAGHYQF